MATSPLTPQQRAASARNSAQLLHSLAQDATREAKRLERQAERLERQAKRSRGKV